MKYRYAVAIFKDGQFDGFMVRRRSPKHLTFRSLSLVRRFVNDMRSDGASRECWREIFGAETMHYIYDRLTRTILSPISLSEVVRFA